jgi:hypothetical protein
MEYIVVATNKDVLLLATARDYSMSKIIQIFFFFFFFIEEYQFRSTFFVIDIF